MNCKWDSEGEATYTGNRRDSESRDSGLWYALYTKARHEKRIETELSNKGIETFTPTVREVHRWSDRRKSVEVPLFSCYTFFRTDNLPPIRYSILNTPGVLRLVGTQNQATPIPHHELVSFKLLVANRVPMESSRFLSVGQQVRIRGGALDGVEGILEHSHGQGKIVVSIKLIQRSVSLSLSGYEIEPA
jgi:transcription antitermination factor NusG